MTELHPSGALWLPEQGTALIADLHLGFAWAQRRRGELWPLTDAGAKSRLESLCDELQPKKLVLVGDIIHAPKPGPEEARLVPCAGSNPPAFQAGCFQPQYCKMK